MRPTLRPYQIEAIERARASTRRSVLVVAPCGAGKTVIAAEYIRQLNARALFLAAQRELIEQTSAKLDAAGVSHGIIMAGIAGHAAPVQVASVQTLVRRDKPPADVVFIDEADLARAESYSKILAEYPRARVVGLTGTPWRLDGKGLGELFEDVVVAATPRQLIDLGHLVEFGGARFEALDTSGIKTTAGDFDQAELGERATGTEQGRRLVGNVVAEYIARTPGKRAACFGVNIGHSKMLAAEFTRAGVAAEHIDGSMPQTERASIFARVRSGETRVLCNFGIVTRGVDIPELEVAILARPTKSLSLFIQMVGRVMRPAPGKSHATIHDHAGLTALHGFPDDDRDYSLDYDPKRTKRVAAIGNRRCPECFAVTEAGAERCPNCGAALTKVRSPAELVVVDGRAIDFAELRSRANESRVVALRDFLWDADVKGHKPQAPAFRFKETFGNWPTKAEVALARRMAGLTEAA